MRYWDASALVPLVVQEGSSAWARALLVADSEIATWGLTRVELASSVERRAREGVLTSAQRRQLLDTFERLAGHCDEVTDLVAVRHRAFGVLARHALRAADATQLGAALVIADGRTRLPFVCLDERLALAADREGLTVLQP